MRLVMEQVPGRFISRRGFCVFPRGRGGRSLQKAILTDLLRDSGGVVNSLDFPRHRLSPLAALLPVCTFFTMEALTVNLRILHCQP